MGRERELADVLACLEDAIAGRGRLLLISGEPGIGKTRLADELATRAKARRAKVVWGRCWEAGGAPPYWPWVQALRSYVRDCDDPTLLDELGVGASHIAQILPEVSARFPDLPAPPSLDPEAARFALFDSVTAFLRVSSGRQPLVLILDDLHAADPPSLLLLQFVAREVAEAPILLVAAFRDLEPGPDHPLTATLAELAREQAARALPLRGLLLGDVRRLVELTAGVDAPQALVASIHRETEGNPLFVGEVIRLLVSEGRLEAPGGEPVWRLTIPSGVREVIGRRLLHLSEEARSVLVLAAVLGREFDLPMFERLTELGSDELLRSLDEAVAARVLAEMPGAPGRFRFAHALIRDTLYEGLTTATRVHLHRAAGEALEALHSRGAGSYLPELARHFFEAAPGGSAEKALEYGRQAAAQAVALLAFEEAARFYHMALRALELTTSPDDETRCELLLAMGDAHARAGEDARAREALLEAADVARTRKAPHQLARAALGYPGHFLWAGTKRDERLIRLLNESLGALGQEESPVRVRLLARLAGALREDPAPEPKDSLSRQAVDMARRIGDPAALAYALGARYTAVWGDVDERLAIASEMIELAKESGDTQRELQGRLLRLFALLERGEMQGVFAELNASSRLAEELRQPAQQCYVAIIRAKLALFEGRFAEAGEVVTEAFELGQRAQSWVALGAFRLQTFVLRKEQGGLEELEESLTPSLDEYPTYSIFRCVLADLYSELGREAEARRLLHALAADGFSNFPLDSDWLFSMALLSEVCSALEGVAGEARILYDLLVPYAGRNAESHPAASNGAVSRYLGLLATKLSRWDEAERHFDDARAMNEETGARPWLVHTHVDYARMLLARDGVGDRAHAAHLLAEALASSKELGMPRLAGKASDLLGQSEGGPALPEAAPPRAVSTGLFRREGEYWAVAFEGGVFRVKDTKGMRYLARLLSEPGRELHALDLVAAEQGAPAHGAVLRLRDAEGRESGLRSAALDDAGEILDPQAKAAYRRRLAELEEELEEARDWNDPERAAKAKEEVAFLTRELAGALGLGGRSRKAASAPERARVNVTRAIRSALARLTDHSPALGRHLEATIRTGTFCSYTPDPRLPISWKL